MTDKEIKTLKEALFLSHPKVTTNIMQSMQDDGIVINYTVGNTEGQIKKFKATVERLMAKRWPDTTFTITVAPF